MSVINTVEPESKKSNVNDILNWHSIVWNVTPSFQHVSYNLHAFLKFASERGEYPERGGFPQKRGVPALEETIKVWHFHKNAKISDLQLAY